MTHARARAALPAAITALAALLTLGGCLNTAAPRLSIADVQVTGVTDAGSSMLVTVRAENPNDQPLPLRTVNYRLTMDGQEVFAATRGAEAVLPRYGVLDLPLPVAVPASARPAGESEFRLSMTLHYLAPGKIAETFYDMHVSRPKVSASGDGVVNLGG